MKVYWAAILSLIAFASALAAAEVMPPKPANYFNDYAHVVQPAVAESLDRELADFERANSDQLVVAIFPKMQTDSSLEDYTQRITDSWGVGQKGKDNGAVLFVFVAEHKLRIQTNYGEEARLTDALSKRIIEDDIAPQLRAGNWDGGMTAGVHAMIAATRGEYQGNGATVRDRQRRQQQGSGSFKFLIFFFIVILVIFRSRRHTTYGGGGGNSFWFFPPGGGGGWGGGSGGGGWSDGGGGGGGGGGFSGGGGAGGGGGASGSW